MAVPATLHKYADMGLMALTTMRKGRNPRDPLTQDEQLFLAGETLFAIRPLVYLVLARAFPKSWGPVFVALGMDAAALAATRTAIARLAPSRSKEEVKHEQDELSRRKFLLLRYLLVSPAYEAGLGGMLASFAENYKDTRGVGFVATLANESMGYYHDLHFYSSGS